MAKECGYLSLALAMIGAMVRSNARYPDLLRAIDVSVEGLEEPVERERYLDMAVFPEDVPISEGPLSALWNIDEIDTRDCMARFVARSLATWVGLGGVTRKGIDRWQRLTCQAPCCQSAPMESTLPASDSGKHGQAGQKVMSRGDICRQFSR